jgi:glutamine---fructose-6-phosphate transaminase (isomerizing)
VRARRRRPQRHHRELQATSARTLAPKGYATETETDTETVALLAQKFMERALSPRRGRADHRRLDGAFALAFLFEGEDDLIIAARKGSPLAIGYGEGEMFLGSDAIALAPLTDRITYLEEGDRAVPHPRGVEIVDAQRTSGQPRSRADRARHRAVDKAGHKHFMAKEIAEQPTVVVAEAIAHYVTEDGIAIPEGELDFAGFDRIVMVACGTAFYACLTARTGSSACGPAGRGRYRLGIPLPRAADRAEDAGDLRLPVGRDRRHAGRAALLRAARR